MRNKPYQLDGPQSNELSSYIAIPRLEPRYAYQQQASQDNELARYIAVLKRHRKLITLTTLSCSIISLTYCLITPPSFTADTTIELRGHAPILASIQSENLFGNDTRKIEYTKTTVAKLKVNGLADAILSRDRLDSELTRYFEEKRSFGSIVSGEIRRRLRQLSPLKNGLAADKKPKISDPHQTRPAGGYFKHSPAEIQRYLSLVSIDPIHETNLVHIRATTNQRALSQKIANLHATEFIEHLKRERQGAIRANVELLHAQSDALRDKVAQAEDQLSAYAASNKLLLARNSEGAILNNRHIESLSQMLADATGRRIKSETALRQAEKQRDDEGTFYDNEITQQLRANLKQSETEYASLGSQVTAAYPTMRELNAKIVALKRAIKDERKQGILTLQAQYSADSQAENNLREQIELEKSKAQEVAKRLIHYDVLSREATSLRELYQAVLKQAKEIEMSASVTTSNVFVADYAALPTAPSAPKTGIIVVLATFAGLGFGVIAAYLKESLSDNLTRVEELQSTLDLPILGSVPEFSKLTVDHVAARLGDRALNDTESANNAELDSTSANSDELSDADLASATTETCTELVTISEPHAAVSEALRTIRANVLLSSADLPPRVIMVSSSMPGEGKTTILGNLAVTLAQAGHRTLMVDGDLRLSGLSRLFNFGPGEVLGLVELLTGQIPIEIALHRTAVEHLEILPVGGKAPNPAELVGSESMKRLLTKLQSSYDFILVDTPPITAVADALLVSRLVDSVVFVVRAGVTKRAVASRALERLVSVKARVIGTVLNSCQGEEDAGLAGRYGVGYG